MLDRLVDRRKGVGPMLMRWRNYSRTCSRIIEKNQYKYGNSVRVKLSVLLASIVPGLVAFAMGSQNYTSNLCFQALYAFHTHRTGTAVLEKQVLHRLYSIMLMQVATSASSTKDAEKNCKQTTYAQS